MCAPIGLSVLRGDPVGNGVTGQLPEVRTLNLLPIHDHRTQYHARSNSLCHDICKLGDRTKVKRTTKEKKKKACDPSLKNATATNREKKIFRDMINRVNAREVRV